MTKFTSRYFETKNARNCDVPKNDVGVKKKKKRNMASDIYRAFHGRYWENEVWGENPKTRMPERQKCNSTIGVACMKGKENM